MKNAKVKIFQRGSSMVFVKNLKFLQLLFLYKINQERVSNEVLARKKVYLILCKPL